MVQAFWPSTEKAKEIAQHAAATFLRDTRIAWDQD